MRSQFTLTKRNSKAPKECDDRAGNEGASEECQGITIYGTRFLVRTTTVATICLTQRAKFVLLGGGMKIHREISSLRHNRRVIGCGCLCLLALILTSAHCQAQTPTPTCTPVPIQSCTPNPTLSCTPSPTPMPAGTCTPCATVCSTCTPPPYPPNADPPVSPIPDTFQPPHDDTVLEWRVFAPIPAPSHGPAILLLHEGHFATGWIFSELLDVPIDDLRRAGYYVFVAAYRQAPCGTVTGQACHDVCSSGRPPQQTNDVKAFIRAMKADGRCNGKFGVVGGSSGASHAAFAVFDISSTPNGAWPKWNQDGADDRPLAAACLSGAYDFTDRTPECGYSPIPEFREKIENYTGTCVLFDPNGGPNQWESSPVAQLQSFTDDKPFRPMFFIHARYDSMPYHQLFDVQCKLNGVGVNSSQYKVLTVTGSPGERGHAFQYWEYDPCDGQGTIGERVITFLDTYLKPH